MKKKILLGSIIAVALLILVSFSSVVGYSSVKSDSKIASPLFGIMTNRATNKEKYVVTSEYICKGKAINILLPKRNSKAELIERFVNNIEMMDEKSLDRIADILFNLLDDENKVNINRENIKDTLVFVSENPEISKNYLLTDNEKGRLDKLTFDAFDYGFFECWLACFVYGFFLIILGIILPFIFILDSIYFWLFEWTRGECCGILPQTLQV